MSDIFREVNEELQNKQMKRLWQRYGLVLIGAAVLVVALTAGYKGWQAYQETVAGERGDRFLAAVQLSKDGKTDEARTAFDQLIKDGGSGYALLAKFRNAGDLASSAIPMVRLQPLTHLRRIRVSILSCKTLPGCVQLISRLMSKISGLLRQGLPTWRKPEIHCGFRQGKFWDCRHGDPRTSRMRSLSSSRFVMTRQHRPNFANGRNLCWHC